MDQFHKNHVPLANLGCKCTYIVFPSKLWNKREPKYIKKLLLVYLVGTFFTSVKPPPNFQHTSTHTWLLWLWLWFGVSYVCACKSDKSKTLLSEFWGGSILLQYNIHVFERQYKGAHIPILGCDKCEMIHPRGQRSTRRFITCRIYGMWLEISFWVIYDKACSQ